MSNTYHLSRAVLGVESEKVWSKEFSLLVEPFGLEDISLLLHDG